MTNTPQRGLSRQLGLFDATMMGLGSIIGTGIFVSIGLAVSVAGPAVILAIALAAIVALCNALSSAQLAANHPTSGGTYEYGYAYLRPWLGFTAGWMFLCAKSASAATAALGFAGYTLIVFGHHESNWRIPLALSAVLALIIVVLAGMRRSSRTNIAIVSITLAALLFFILAGLPTAFKHAPENLSPFFNGPNADARHSLARLLEAAALMFVAYTGYGRIATLAEEVRTPRRTIPRAIIITLLLSMMLYLAVALVGICAVGAATFADQSNQRAAPLAAIARNFNIPGAGIILSIGAVTAMLGVLLNLILGLSRVVLAMARRRDLPAYFDRLNASATTPTPAVLLVGAIILALTTIGSIKLAWSFSAFTVLIYYAITNLAAIHLPRKQRLYHPAIAWTGLLACLSLAFWVEPRIWLVGLALIALALIVRALARSLRKPTDEHSQ